MDSEIFEKYESSAQQEASSGQPPFLLELGGGGSGVAYVRIIYI